MTVTSTVTSMTTVSDFCAVRSPLSEPQSNVAYETKNMTPTRAPTGMSIKMSLIVIIMMNKASPATNVDRRPRAPDETLMTDWPIIAQPGIPPKKPAMMLAMP